MAAKLFKRLKSGLGVILFLYGAAFHFIVLRMIVRESYRPPADRSFVDHPLTNLGVMFFGGLFTGIVISWVLSKLPGIDFQTRALRIIFGAMAAVLSTVLALQAMIVLTSAYLAWIGVRDAPLMWPGAFLVAMVDVETFGLIYTVQSVPHSFLAGAGMIAILEGFLAWGPAAFVTVGMSYSCEGLAKMRALRRPWQRNRQRQRRGRKAGGLPPHCWRTGKTLPYDGGAG